MYGASRDKKPCVPTVKTVWEGVYNWLGYSRSSEVAAYLGGGHGHAAVCAHAVSVSNRACWGAMLVGQAQGLRETSCGSGNNLAAVPGWA